MPDIADDVGSNAVRVLKKYPNRRIYDTTDSRYITLLDVQRFIFQNQTVQVLDFKNGKDITRSVLLQIIGLLESGGNQTLLTNSLLTDLIRLSQGVSGALSAELEE